MTLRRLAFATVFLTSPAMAQTADPDSGARQAVALFLHACIDNKADTAAVRNWMNSRHVPQLTAEALPIFLNHRPGIGYDASDPTGRYALTSEDDGVCSVYADKAKDTAVIGSLEQSVLNNAQQSLKRLSDYPDEHEPRLHHYDYVVMLDGVIYGLVVSTDAVPGHLQASLSFWRRGPSGLTVPGAR